ncbi:DNA mismatch repair protein Mlh1 [Blastocladiella emersonii ATCC 22665]|nr:DNA mismatch repair protein Mlh1 [Blastocladiella emersonii ATCC 22665]
MESNETSSSAATPKPPRRIQPLDATVVNRIAAGEVIHRPAHALKELLENAIDAGAARIAVTCRDGGLKLLEVVDDGNGIHRDDLPILCERFTTSKLRAFEDLAAIATYGFRGEALASISHVAHLAVTTRTRDSVCAFRATYCDGKLAPDRPGAPADPKPCAGNQGTVVSVQDLFYNLRNRQRAMKPGEEMALVADTVARYAVHNAHIGFTLRRAGAGAPEVSTNPGASRIDQVRAIYGNAIARELIEIPRTEADRVTYSALVTNPNYATKKLTLLLFINHRLVESATIKRALDRVFEPHLPKGMHPWIYVALDLPPHTVDVNVHPTKKEVHFMHQDHIVDTLVAAVRAALESAGQSRHYKTTTLVPGPAAAPTPEVVSFNPPPPPVGEDAPTPQVRASRTSSAGSLDAWTVPPPTAAATPRRSTPSASAAGSAASTPRIPSSSAARRESHLVRTDSRATTLDQFFTPIRPPPPPKAVTAETPSRPDAVNRRSTGDTELFDGLDGSLPAAPSLPAAVDSDAGAAWVPYAGEERDLGLASIHELRTELDALAAASAADPTDPRRTLLANHTFVGWVHGALVAVQSGTDLYLADVGVLADAWFYQRALELFGNYPAWRLARPVPLADLVAAALELPDANWTPDLPPKPVIAEHIARELVLRRDMLADYFSLEISDDGMLATLPRLLRGYTPAVGGGNLAMLVLRLGTEVDWTAERPCLAGILDEIARFYSPRTLVEDEGAGDGVGVPVRVAEHVLLPALRSLILAPELVAAGFVRLANLHELYKVFERC